MVGISAKCTTSSYKNQSKQYRNKWNCPVIHTLETHLILTISDSREVVFDLTGMLVLLSLYVYNVGQNLCACGNGFGLIVYLSVSLRPVLQIKALVSARWRGHDSQLTRSKLIQPPICLCTCVFACQSVCFPIHAHVLSEKPFLISLSDWCLQKTQKQGKCIYLYMHVHKHF